MAKKIDLTPYMIDIWGTVACDLLQSGYTCKTSKRTLAKKIREKAWDRQNLLRSFSSKRSYVFKHLVDAGYMEETKTEWGSPQWNVLKFLEESKAYAVEPENMLEPYKEALFQIDDYFSVENYGYVLYTALPKPHILHYFWHPELYEVEVYEKDERKLSRLFHRVRPKDFHAKLGYTIPRQLCMEILKNEYWAHFEEVTGFRYPIVTEARNIELGPHFLKDLLFNCVGVIHTDEGDSVVTNLSHEKARVTVSVKYIKVLVATIEKLEQVVNKHGGLKALTEKILRHVVETMVSNAPLQLGEDSQWDTGVAKYVLKHPEEFKYDLLFPEGLRVIDRPDESKEKIAVMERSIAILEGRIPDNSE